MGSDDVPTFFFSHARQDRDISGEGYLVKFFKDLQARVAAYTGADLKSDHIGTIDTEVLQGEDWDKKLSEPLKTDKVFIAILSPTYFKREDCGKELFAFVQRSSSLSMDSIGRLTNVKNVLPIRWYDDEVYSLNGKKEERIPKILRRINYMPRDNSGDTKRTKAIERYRTKGMHACFQKPHYPELLHLFALRIRDLEDLPPNTNSISFATLPNAFTYDWKKHFDERGKPVEEVSLPTADAEQIEPRALDSVVVFYVTNRAFEPDPTAVNFADQLIAKSPVDDSAGTDSMLATLLADVQAAGDEEEFIVFHAAADPVVPDSPEPLLARLASLSASDVLTALVVDPTVWPATNNPQAAAVESIIASGTWTGPVLLPFLDTAAIDLNELATARGLSRRIIALPQESEARVEVLNRAFVAERGRTFSTSSTGLAPDAESPPGLKGVRPEGE